MTKNNNKAIVLISGGIDSAVILAQAIKDGRVCSTLSFDYSQRHRLELRAAQAIARFYNVPHQIIKVDCSAFARSSLASAKKIPQNRSSAEIAKAGIPSTYVPGRNTLFLAYAMGQAEMMDASEIYYGPNAMDYVPYPDCRPEFIHAFQQVLNVATQQAQNGKAPKLVAPLVHMRKEQILTLAHALKVPLELTLSCYDPTSLSHHCGICDACVLRKEAFSLAGLPDPTKYKV